VSSSALSFESPVRKNNGKLGWRVHSVLAAGRLSDSVVALAIVILARCEEKIRDSRDVGWVAQSVEQRTENQKTLFLLSLAIYPNC
jgi:hypothetical protein